jgi:Rps23 Pro-64 3,4-dihydroxylase Tpa1-like proline 4-hydroxylase
MLREMNSRQFLLFLESLTGIDNLLPDPYFIGGGVHISGRGDFLNIHADFNWHHKLQAYRRVNALLYLSDNWQPEWRGAIEFWNKDMSCAEASALPLFNRLVLFSTGEHSNHGQREPNECPQGAYRKVLNLYYYTSRRDDGDVADPHFTLYKTQASQFAVELGEEYRKSAE